MKRAHYSSKKGENIEHIYIIQVSIFNSYNRSLSFYSLKCYTLFSKNLIRQSQTRYLSKTTDEGIYQSDSLYKKSLKLTVTIF